MNFLFVDRLVHSVPGQLVQGIKHVQENDFYLTTDEEGRLCFIPSLIGETLGQLAAWNVMQSNGFQKRPVAGIVASARLYRPAFVGEMLLLESFIDKMDESAVQYHSIARVGNEVVFVVEGALGPLLPMDDFIETSIVKQQYQALDKPGDWALHCAHSVPVADFCTQPSPKVTFCFDTISAFEPGQSLVAEMHVDGSAPYFPDHFPKKPVLPMTVLLEAKLNLAREFVARSAYAKTYQVVELRKIKMNEFVQPGDVVTCSVKVKQQNEMELVLTYRSEVANKRVCVLEVVLISKGV